MTVFCSHESFRWNPMWRLGLFYIAIILIFAFVTGLLSGSDLSAQVIPETAQDQSPETGSPVVPYRRVFIPNSQLSKVVGLDQSFTFQPWNSIAQTLQRISVNPGTDAGTASSDLTTPLEVSATIYSARLNGSRLVSIRSLISSSRGSILGEQIALRPWDLSITSAAIAPNRGDLQNLAGAATSGVGAGIAGGVGGGLGGGFSGASFPPLAYDSIGTPILNLWVPTGTEALVPRNYFVGWVLNGKQQPNGNLLFEGSIPATKNSCLLLTLPPHTTVEQSNAPAIRVDDFSILESRLAMIPEEVRPAFERTPTDPIDQALWLIELGGMSRFSFQLATAADRNPRGDTKQSAMPYQFLVTEQTNKHTLEGNYLLTESVYEVQWDPSPSRSTIKIMAKPTSKVRSVRIAGNEIDWTFNRGEIEIAANQLDEIAGKLPGKLLLTVETLDDLPVKDLPVKDLAVKNLAVKNEANLSPANAYSIALPGLPVQNSFVLRGRTSVEIDRSQKFASTDVSNGSYGDSQLSNQRVFLWRDRPCDATISVESTPITSNARITTRVSGQGSKLSVSSRLLMSAAPESDVELIVAAGWTAEEIVYGELQRTELLADGSSKFLLAPSLFANPSNFVDVRLKRSATHRSDSSVDIPASGLVQLPQSRTQSIVLIENLPSHYSVDRSGRWSEISIDSLPASERGLVVVSDKCKAWRQVDGTMRITERVSQSNPRLALTTRFEHESETQIRVVHSIELANVNTTPFFAFKIESDQHQWVPAANSAPWLVSSRITQEKLPESQGDLAGDSVVSQVKNEELFHCDITKLSEAERLSAVLEIESMIELGQFPNRLPLPTFFVPLQVGISPESDVEQSVPFDVFHSVVTDDRVAISDSKPNNIHWSFLEHGDLIGTRDNYAGELSVTSMRIPAQSTDSSIVSSASYDFALDPNEHAKVEWNVVFDRLVTDEIVFELDDGWVLDVASLKASGGETSVWGVKQKDAPNQMRVMRSTAQGMGQTRDTPIQISFTGSSLDREKLEAPVNKDTANLREFMKRFVGRSVKAPQLKINGVIQSAVGRLWLPQSSNWGTFSSNQVDQKRFWSIEYGLRWWDRGRDLLSGRPIFSQQTDTASPTLPASLSQAFPTGSWRFDSSLSSAAGSLVSADQSETLIVHWSLLDVKRIQFISYGIFSAILLLCVCLRNLPLSWKTTVYSLLVLACSLPLLFGPIGEAIVTGALSALAIGLPLSAVLCVFERKIRVMERFQDGSTANWGSPNSIVKKSGSVGTGLIVGMCSLCWFEASLSAAPFQPAATFQPAMTYPGPGLIQGATMVQGAAARTIDIIIPTDDSGNVVGDSAYVPNSLLASVAGTPKADFQVYSAKHSLRINQRNRATSTPDQCVTTYEVWVGRLQQPIKFPVKRTQGTLSKFSVDDIDISVGQRLEIQDDAIVWTPERIGRFTIQLTVSMTWQSENATPTASLRGERWVLQTTNLGVLPTANALLEIESADPTVLLTVNSLGGMANPSPGRYVVALGNLNALQLSTKIASNAPLTPVPSTGSQNASLTLEFMFQGAQVRVMSNIQVPQGVSWSKQFTLEVDDAWVPIGTRWKGVSLVSSKNASLVSRKQYVFEVDQTELDKPKFDLPILWGLRSRPVSFLNVLFMNCVDDHLRVVPTIFRYGGHPGSEWAIEGVRSWENALTEKDRFQWDDILSTNYSAVANPVVTSLRFPANNGYGIIRRIERRDNLSARISARWSLLHDEQQLVVRMETFGSYNSDIMQMILPEGFQVAEARHNLTPFTVNQSPSETRVVVKSDVDPANNDLSAADSSASALISEASTNSATGPISSSTLSASTLSASTKVNQVQLIASREDFEGHEITLRAIKYGPLTNLSPPWLSIPDVNISDYTMELSVDENWLALIHTGDGNTKRMPGRGGQTPISLLNAQDRVEITPRPIATVQDLGWSIERTATAGRYELTIAGVSTIPPEANSKFTIEFPTSRFSTWRADRNETQINSPFQDYTWVQVDAGTATDVVRTSDWRFTFPLQTDQLRGLSEASPGIRILEAPDFAIRSSEVADWIAQNGVDDENQNKKDLQQSPANSTTDFHYTLRLSNSSNQHRRKEVIWTRKSLEAVELQLPAGSETVTVAVNGMPVPYKIENSRIRFQLPIVPESLLQEISLSYAITSTKTSTEENPFDVESSGETFYKTISKDEALRVINDFLTYADYYLPERMVQDSYAANWLLNAHCSVVELQSESNFDPKSPDLRLAKQNFLIHRASWPELEWAQVPPVTSPQFGLASNKEITGLQLTHERILYACITLAVLSSMLWIGLKFADWPALVVAGLTIPIWGISGNWQFVSIIALCAALITLDNYWLRRRTGRRTINRFR